MRNFITIKNEKERKIFLDYCKKHNTKLIGGTKVIDGKPFHIFEKACFQIFFQNDCFDRLTYSTGTKYAQYSGGYNEIKFNDFFRVNYLDIE